MGLLLFLSLICSSLSLGDTHTLQYLYTVNTSGVKFAAVGLLDGEQFVYYDSNISQMIPKKEFVKKVEADKQQFWNRETRHVQTQQEKLDSVMKDFSHTEGIQTLELMYSCERDDNTTRGYAQFGYDGEDFFSLDLKTGTWAADKPQAKIFIKQWDPTGIQAKHWKSYLENNCIDWLSTVVFYGRETLERKVHPNVSLFQKHSSSPEVVCFATGFFPKSVMISWQKDGEDVYEDVYVRDTLPNQDGSFQKRSILKVPAEDLQKHNYTCVIQHSSLEEELVLPVSERRILRGGGSDGARIGIIVGVVLAVVFAAGYVVC